MHLILEIISGPLIGKEIVVEAHQVVRVGRTAKADFPTQDSFMSGEHFAVEGDGKVWHIRDLNSRNGTKLNGEIVKTAQLREGDRVHAGSIDFLVRITGSAQASYAKSNRLMSTLPPSIPLKESPRGIDSAGVPDSTASSSPSNASTGNAAAKPSKHRSSKSGKLGTTSGKLGTTSRSRRVSKSGIRDVNQQAEAKAPPGQPHLEALETSPAPPRSALESYQAVTPEGRLLRLLSNQPEPLMALVDATHEPNLLKRLAGSGEEFQALYQDPKSAAIAPYLVRLPPKSSMLKQMVHDGWGHGWGVYLTCKLPLAQLRDYFRQVLMVKLPDGVELFSRFYDPRFFRAFLESCTSAEAEKFFGPVSSYLMEGEKSEILLQFTLTSRGAEKKGHLLSTLE
jgi:pSer/pThr/pTyr-binding forkhead associated (FHA) protein